MLQEAELESETRRAEHCTLLSEKSELVAEVERLSGELAESNSYQEKYNVVSDELCTLREKHSKAVSLNRYVLVMQVN